MNSVDIILLSFNNKHLVGFNDNKLKTKCQYGTTLKQFIDNLNMFRSPSEQIKTIYNIKNRQIPESMWGFKIKESLTFKVDTEHIEALE